MPESHLSAVPVSEVDEATVEAERAAARRASRIKSMRDYLDWAEAHPDAQLPELGTIYDYCGVEDMTSKARGFGGRWTKRTDDDYFHLEQEVAPGIVYRLYAMRDQVCEAVVVGQEKVEVTDYEAVKLVPKKTVTRDVIEWRCPPSLLAAAEPDEAA